MKEDRILRQFACQIHLTLASWQHYYAPAVGALSDDARLTSV